MKVKILFFGPTHDLTGVEEQQLEIPEGENLRGLWSLCSKQFPRLREAANSLLFAVNRELADPSRLLREGDEVAFLPPVSGGASDDFFVLTRQPIATPELTLALKAPRDGAVVVFEGIVRDHSQGRRTLYLEYEAYEPMAVEKMREIGREAQRQFDVDRIGMIHRLGRLEIGETSVAIWVTSAHRRAAFAACQYAIDRLKQVVPIWKKEYFEDGAVWAEGEGASSLQQSAFSEQREKRTEGISSADRSPETACSELETDG